MRQALGIITDPVHRSLVELNLVNPDSSISGRYYREQEVV